MIVYNCISIYYFTSLMTDIWVYKVHTVHRVVIIKIKVFTQTSMGGILWYSWVFVEGFLAKLTHIPCCVVLAIITNSISFCFIVGAAVSMTIAFTCWKQEHGLNNYWISNTPKKIKSKKGFLSWSAYIYLLMKFKL